MRTREVAGWLPAVLLVPAALVGLVAVSEPSDTAVEAMAEVLPLDPGTTWVYAVSDHGEPSGHRTRQVLGPVQLFLDDGIRSGVRISSVYDAYPGRGPVSNDVYVGVHGRDLLQYALVTQSGTLDVTPPAPAYRLPPASGTTWHHEGLLGPSTELEATAEVTDQGEVEVGGRTFTDCTEWTTEQVVPDSDGALETVVEWTCPDIGVVQSRDVYEADDVDITEELVAFSGASSVWTAEPPGPADPVDDDTTAAGLDQARSGGVPDTVTDTLAWTDARSVSSAFSLVSEGSVEVTGELDGLVSATDVASGETRWQVGLEPPVVVAPAVGGGQVFAADGAKRLWALSIEDGTADWVATFGDVASAVPVVTDEALVVALEDATVVALDRADGDETWSTDLDGRAVSDLALADGLVVVADDTGSLTALDAGTGDTTWSTAVEESIEEGPAVSGDHVLVVDGFGVVTSFDLEDGSVQWQARTRGFPSWPLATGSGVVVTAGSTGRVEAYDLDDGSRAWTRRTAGTGTAPVVAGDQVVAVSDTGRVEVRSVADGSLVDSWSLPRPEPGSRLDVTGPLSVVDDTLVVSAEPSGTRFDTTSYAFRLVGAGDRGDGAAPGVHFEADVREFAYSTAVPPVVDGDDTYVVDIAGTLQRDDGSGPVPLREDVSPSVGFAAGDGVVVLPLGDEVLGIDGADGEQLWTVPAGEAFVESVPAVAGGAAFVPVQGAGLASVGLRDGEIRWLAELPGARGSSTPLPLPGGDVAYAAGGLARFDGRTGEEVWRLGGDLTDAVAYSEITQSGGTVYANLTADVAGVEQTVLVAVDAANGRVRWRRPVLGAPFGIGPAAGDGTVVAVDGANLVHVLDARTGEERWTYQLATPPSGPATVHDGTVLMVQRGREEDGVQRDYRVTAHDAGTGAFLGAYQPPVANETTLPTGASTADGRLLLSSTGPESAYVLLLEAVRG